MQIGNWLKKSTQKLTAAGIKSAQLDCLILLEDELHTNRVHLLAHPDLELTPVQVKHLNLKLDRRANREPLAYIRGHIEFYGRTFIVNKHVLVPRPESESFIFLLLKKPKRFHKLLDVGTGSGILGITAQLELPLLEVTLSDISTKALDVAKANASKLGAHVTFKQANLLKAFYKHNIIFANLPYVPSHMSKQGITNELDHEPDFALFAGADGMDLYRQFWQQIQSISNKPQYVYTESLAFQHQQMTELARRSGYIVEDKNGLVQVFSLVQASVQE